LLGFLYRTIKQNKPLCSIFTVKSNGELYLNLTLNRSYKLIYLYLGRLILDIIYYITSYANKKAYPFELSSIEVGETKLTYYSPDTYLNTKSIHLTKNDSIESVRGVKRKNSSSLAFNEWLAGVIDGDGYFNLSKKGIARFNVVMDIRDKEVLYEIKHKFGGSIYTISNANALKYQLSGKVGLIALINAVNGLIRNPVRMLQMNKLCVKYEIELLYPKPLTYNNGWFSGFMDSDGSIYLNEISGQVFISASQKNRYLLEPLIKLYSGRVDIISPRTEAFKYIIYRKQEVFNMVDNYFCKYPLKSKKQKRINLIKEFYLKRPSLKNKDILKLKE
jgi:hypothetical protein